MNTSGILLFLLLIVTILLYIYILRKKENLKRTLRLAFLRITLPKKNSDLDEKQETTKDFKEMIGLMEQLFASLNSILSHKLKKKILGQDHISLEYITHNGEILFYVVCPNDYKNLIEKQINGFYPDAIIEETLEVNIFANRKYWDSTYINTRKNYFYPIKTYQKLESDPINNITNAFSKLEEDESAAVQILIKPLDDDWQEECQNISSKIMEGKKEALFTLNPIKIIVGFINAFTKDENEKDSGPKNKTSALTQERAKTVDEKADKMGYKTIIRIITTGNSKSGVKTELTNIISTFRQFTYPEFNGFKYTIRHRNDILVRNYIFRYFQKPLWLKTMILNTEELASIFHFPHIRYNKTPEIKWQNFKIVKAPSDIPKEGILIGDNIYRGIKKEIRIKTEDRFRHFYIIGQTGTGKSSTLQVLARQDLINGSGIAVIDPHGDLVKDLVSFIPRSRADDVIIFNPADMERPIGLNLLEAHTPEERDLVAMDAMNIMIKLFGNEVFGPRIQDYFRNGVLALMEYPEGGALTDIVRLFTDEDFQKERIRHVKNPIVKVWWEKTYPSIGEREKGEMIPYFSAKFGQFITNTMMRNIIGQVKSSFDIGEVMNTGKILMVNLSKGILGDINSELLGLILVSKIQMAAMRRQNMNKNERKDFFMYIDEFQNYITPSIESILSEARKYRLGLILAHQYLGQLEKSDALTKSNLNLKGAVFGNIGTVMCYKIGP
ncbi:MAG: type IV secretion system DNA-binding domain-containing protein, partial [Candidatus Gracilibacteria bacterium]|nr:type IV secretion system DNA-binding domain-containing protein [Candidatus Gracilibacteria bacterium]